MSINVNGVTDTPVANTGTTTKQTANNNGVDFSQALAEALEKQVVANGVALSGGTKDSVSSVYGNSSLSSSTGGIEQIIMSAAATGDVSQAQIALFMLCTMMQENADGEFGELFGMMAAMLGGMQGGSDSVSYLRESVMHTDEYSAYTKDQVDQNVFGPPVAVSVSGAVIPTSCWVPTTPAIVNMPGDRSPEKLREVIDQFNVETATRYEPGRDGYTYCNIFVWDVTRALGAEIPHYTDAATGDIVAYPDIKSANQLKASAMYTWLKKNGERYGWREVDAETAQRYANEGKPAATFSSATSHAQMVCPSVDGSYDPIRGVTVAQAGSKVTNYTYISNVYSANGLKDVHYFVHE